jgi:hypothetical protein
MQAAVTQVPAVHVWPAEHLWPHVPQLFTSLCKFTQLPLQHDAPEPQQTPLHSRVTSALHCTHRPVPCAASETHCPRCGPGGNACWQKCAQPELPPPCGALPADDVPGGSGLSEDDPPPAQPTPSELKAAAASAPPTRRTASRRGIRPANATVFAKTSK